MGDLDCTGCLHPGFSINLHREGFCGLERDLGALGQPVSSTLEPGIDLTHLNHTLYSYDFQPLVTHVWHTGFENIGVCDYFGHTAQCLVDPTRIPVRSLGVTPEIGATMHARDIQYRNAFEGQVTQIQQLPTYLDGH